MAAATAETARVEAPAATTGQAAVAYPLPEVREPTRMVAVVAMVSSPLMRVPVGMQMVGEAGELTVPATAWYKAQHEVVVAQVLAAEHSRRLATVGIMKVLFI